MGPRRLLQRLRAGLVWSVRGVGRLVGLAAASVYGPVSGGVRWLVWGLLFRWLAAVAYDDSERWRLPGEALVEVGMAIEVD